MKTLHNKFFLLTLLLLLNSMPAAADIGDPTEDEDPEDAPLNPAPIDDYMVPLLLVGVATGYFLIKRNKLQSDIL